MTGLGGLMVRLRLALVLDLSLQERQVDELALRLHGLGAHLSDDVACHRSQTGQLDRIPTAVQGVAFLVRKETSFLTRDRAKRAEDLLGLLDRRLLFARLWPCLSVAGVRGLGDGALCGWRSGFEDVFKVPVFGVGFEQTFLLATHVACVAHR